MDNMPDKFKAALDVFRTMLAKEGLREGVKVADDLLKELAEHKVSVLPAQEELWRKLFKKLNTVGVTDFSDADINLISNLYELKSFALSLKSEQPEAIEFAEWLISEGHWNLGDYNDGSFTIDGLYKEYLKNK